MIGHGFLYFVGWYGGGPVNIWGGIASDLSEIAIVGGVAGAYHKHNCHERRCWRIGKHSVDGTPWCNKHHKKARKEANALA